MALLRAIVVTAVLAGVLSAGCVKKSTHQKVLDELAATQTTLGDTQSERDAKGKRIGELEEELGMTAAERDAKSRAEREKAAKIAALLVDMKTTQEELLELRKQQEKTHERLRAFRELNERFRKLVDTGKLQVSFRGGQMVLKLPSEVLFASGQGELSDAGEAALAEVLEVLKAFQDRRFLIAGHTDNVAINSRKYKNNWYLSTARAVSVLEFMIQAGFDPKNLGAAGYGEFDPVAPNDTDVNRQLNRRIEIILVPDLSELPNLTADE